ncbi:MAG: hypothetical protein ACPG88_07135, partial [Porticoccaceae bacterium]
MAKNFLRRRSKLIFDRLKVEDMAVTANRLESWLNSDFGRYLLHQETQLLARKYNHLPGYRL